MSWGAGVALEGKTERIQGAYRETERNEGGKRVRRANAMDTEVGEKNRG